MKRMGLLIIPLLLIFASFGCLGYGEGYNDKAKEYTSADYTIQTYKDYIAKYNAICNVGSSAEIYTKQLADFDTRTVGMALSFSESSQRGQIESAKGGYIAQYNRLASEYNTMTMDKTQDWLKIASLPEHVMSYTDENHLSNNNWIDDKVLGD
jgi:hypothetical protein